MAARESLTRRPDPHTHAPVKERAGSVCNHHRPGPTELVPRERS